MADKCVNLIHLQLSQTLIAQTEKVGLNVDIGNCYIRKSTINESAEPEDNKSSPTADNIHRLQEGQYQ